MGGESWTYAKAGVDIDRKSGAIASLVGQLGFRRVGKGTRVDAKGQFAGLIEFGDDYLTLCTDGVGTKLLVAESMGVWDTIGIDCIAMNVNDAICVGSEPMAFVDYIAIERPDEDVTRDIGIGLERGAELSNMDIVGGEIAVLPEMVNGVDVSGTCLGYVPRDRLVDGTAVTPGDVIVGVPSSGVHSNGLTLARKVVEDAGLGYDDNEPRLSRTVGEELLVPTRIYVREVMDLMSKVNVHGMVNITGGSLRNLLRLNDDVRCVIDDPMEPQPVFGLLAELGRVDVRECYQTFNMGMGFAIVVGEDDVTDVESVVSGARAVGRIESGSGVFLETEGLLYEDY